MRLMNTELAEALEKYPLYSQDGKKADAVVVAKYFFPATALTWYVTEGRKEDDDYLFFGLVVGTDTTTCTSSQRNLARSATSLSGTM